MISTESDVSINSQALREEKGLGTRGAS